MADWRIGRGWTTTEIEERLAALKRLGRNFSATPDEMIPENGWHQYFSEAVIAREGPGPPSEGGPFKRGRTAVTNYAFSEPGIVVAYFDPDRPLLGRHMLLEMRALQFLHYLSGVVVGAVRSETEADRTVFGYRYDTLEGHIERGSEWFLLTKEHATGEIRFRIEAAWSPGDFPNWWSRLGFAVLGRYYQKRWHHRAHALLARQVRDPSVQNPRSAGGRLVHTDPEVIFTRL